MTDIGTFIEPTNKMVSLLPWEPWPSEFEVQKNDSLALIRIFFETNSCLLALTTSPSHVQSCFKIVLGLIKVSCLISMSDSKILFGDYHEMAPISARTQAFDQVFKVRTAASTMQKINPVDYFNLCHWRFVYIQLFPVIWRKSLKSDYQSWRKKF